jgi:TolB-like protein
MSSIIEGYNYDIFISYRQKDNKGGRLGVPFGGTTQSREAGWVSEFVDALKTELESTFKEEISVYFDINPHDGLLETHDVNASLKEKLKCLIFIPIISRTYCDPKSFAWEYEFKAFVEQTTKDQFGLKVKLPNGNIASRVLPVRIYDLDASDIKLCESVLGSVLRGVDFIYKSPGVNRPLLLKEENSKDNLNHTNYRDQINKVANSIKEIVRGLKGEPLEFVGEQREDLANVEKPAIQEKSIIVLPFENISSDPDQEYFSDGLTEEIITDLSHIHDFLVISRSSAMTFKGTKKTIPEIAQTVNVRYVLEGSVRKAGNNLRITAQLIDALTDTHLWAEKYSGILENVFDIQEKVSKSIANELKLKLSIEEKNRVFERPVKNILSYEYYLKAKQEIYNFTGESISKAIVYLQKALGIEGDNSCLYAELAHAYYQFWNMGIRIEEDDLEKANEYVKKAFELDNESPDGHFVSGLLEITGGDAKLSISHFKKVLQKSPNHTNALTWICMVYGLLGFSEKTNYYFNRLSQIDPFSPFIENIPMLFYIMNGEFVSAEALTEQLGSNDFNLLMKTWSLMYNRKCEDAFVEFIKISEYSKNSYMFRATLMLIYAYQRKDKEVIQLIDDKFLLWAKRDFQYSLFVTDIYALLNFKVDALHWLENSIKHGFINYPYLNIYDPFLDHIRDEKQFKKLLERVKYEWENFEV